MHETEHTIEYNGEDIGITVQWLEEVEEDCYPVGDTTVTDTYTSYEPFIVTNDDGDGYYEWNHPSKPKTAFELAVDEAYCNGDIEP